MSAPLVDASAGSRVFAVPRIDLLGRSLAELCIATAKKHLTQELKKWYEGEGDPPDHNAPEGVIADMYFGSWVSRAFLRDIVRNRNAVNHSGHSKIDVWIWMIGHIVDGIDFRKPHVKTNGYVLPRNSLEFVQRILGNGPDFKEEKLEETLERIGVEHTEEIVSKVKDCLSLEDPDESNLRAELFEISKKNLRLVAQTQICRERRRGRLWTIDWENTTDGATASLNRTTTVLHDSLLKVKKAKEKLSGYGRVDPGMGILYELDDHNINQAIHACCRYLLDHRYGYVTIPTRTT